MDWVTRTRNLIQAALQAVPVDLLLKRGRVLDVLTGEISRADVAVHQGVVVGVGSGYSARETMDLEDRVVLPGFIEAHLHVESTLLTPPYLAEAVVRHGTTAIVADPHEIANVLGLDGIRWMLAVSQGLDVDFFFMAPSCVPATASESAGATLDAGDLAQLSADPRILGLAEVMNVPGVLGGDQGLLEKLALFWDRVLDGHAPLLRGTELQAYLMAGIRSDHETSDPEEAREKLARGMFLMIREGSTARNLKSLISLVNPLNAHRFALVSDDLAPGDIFRRGHLNHLLHLAVAQGLDPRLAVRLVTVNPAAFFGLRDRGAVIPGNRADLVVVEDLQSFQPFLVVKDGRPVALKGRRLATPGARKEPPEISTNTVNIGNISLDNLVTKHEDGAVRVIEIVPGQLFTRQVLERVPRSGPELHADPGADRLKLCVVERHRGTGRVGLGLVRGFGLRHGALATSVAHDSHNVVAVGVEDLSILRAVERVREMGGGMVAAGSEGILAEVPLQIAGLMFRGPLPRLLPHLDLLHQAARRLGCPLEEPFMMLSFLALPVIPELKLTDRGLVHHARPVSLFVEESLEERT